jgi:DNA-binding transcriptional regulator YdaS (Cro superfamily)
MMLNVYWDDRDFASAYDARSKTQVALEQLADLLGVDIPSVLISDRDWERAGAATRCLAHNRLLAAGVSCPECRPVR